jgi:hypothetical protein
MREMWILLKEYDVDRSGSLDVKELTNLIVHHAIECSPGTTVAHLPSEAEILWILKAAGKYKQNLIHVEELDLALQLWRSYVRNRVRIEFYFNKYDTGQSQRLDFDQMKLYLTDLDGRPPKVVHSSIMLKPPNRVLASRHLSSRYATTIPVARLQTPSQLTRRRAELRGPRHHARGQRRRRH